MSRFPGSLAVSVEPPPTTNHKPSSPYPYPYPMVIRARQKA